MTFDLDNKRGDGMQEWTSLLKVA